MPESYVILGFPGGPVVKNLPVNAGDVGSIPGFGRSPEGNSNPLPYSCLKNSWKEKPGGLQSMGLQKGRTQLSSQTTATYVISLIEMKKNTSSTHTLLRKLTLSFLVWFGGERSYIKFSKLIQE